MRASNSIYPRYSSQRKWPRATRLPSLQQPLQKEPQISVDVELMLKSRNYVKDMLNPVLLQRRHEVQRMLWGNHRIRVPVLDEYRRNSSTHIADRTRPSHQLLLGQPSHLLKHSAQPRAPGRRDTEIQRCSQYRGTDHRTVNIRVTQLVTLQLRDALDECPQRRQMSPPPKSPSAQPGWDPGYTPARPSSGSVPPS